MVTTPLETRQSEERAGKCRANLEERARGHTTTGRRSDSDGTSRQSVTKQSRKSQSWRRHGALARCCGRSSRSEEHTSELQSRLHLVCRLLLEKKKNTAR